MGLERGRRGVLQCMGRDSQWPDAWPRSQAEAREGLRGAAHVCVLFAVSKLADAIFTSRLRSGGAEMGSSPPVQACLSASSRHARFSCRECRAAADVHSEHPLLGEPFPLPDRAAAPQLTARHLCVHVQLNCRQTIRGSISASHSYSLSYPLSHSHPHSPSTQNSTDTTMGCACDPKTPNAQCECGGKCTGKCECPSCPSKQAAACK